MRGSKILSISEVGSRVHNCLVFQKEQSHLCLHLGKDYTYLYRGECMCSNRRLLHSQMLPPEGWGAGQGQVAGTAWVGRAPQSNGSVQINIKLI